MIQEITDQMKKIQETMENEIKIQRLEEAAKEATEEFSNLTKS